MSRPPFSPACLDHVVLRVARMDEALAFYCDVIGAKEERRVPAVGLVQLRVGQSLIDLIDATLDGSTDRQVLDHFCIRVEPWDEALIVEHLAKFGVNVIERGPRYGAQGVGPSLYIRDPFGTVVELKGPASPVESELPVLTTARLILRPARLSDAEALFPLFVDSETMQFWAHGPVTSVADVRQIIARNLVPRNKPESSFAITEDGNLAIGCVNFYEESDAMAGLGYIIGKSFWGRGLVSEAVNAALLHGFVTLKLHRIWLDIDPQNHASVRVAGKCGFSAEGVQRQAFFMDGAYLDSAIFGLLREDWIRLRGASSASGK